MDLPNTAVINLQATSLVLRTRSQKSCALALLEGSPAEIQTFCSYDIVRAELPREVFKLGRHRLLLSNLEEVELVCPEQNYMETYKLTQKQTVFDIPCGCSVAVDNHFLIENNLYCRQLFIDKDTNDTGSKLSPYHIVNISYLEAFGKRRIKENRCEGVSGVDSAL